VVGAVALFGLSLLLAGARRTSLRGRAARRGLKQSRHETAAVSRDRDDMIDQRDTARAETASARQDEAARGDAHADSEAGPVAGSADSPVVASTAGPVAGSADSPVVASTDTPVAGSAVGPANGRQRWQLFGHRPAHQQAADTGSAAPAGQPTAAVPADEPVAAE
jgi:hypothetical protein